MRSALPLPCAGLARACAVLLVTAGCFEPPPAEPVDVALSDRPCNPAVDNEACFSQNGSTRSVRCNTLTSRWQVEQFCPSNACTETPDPASPGKKQASCKSGGFVDAGTTDVKKDVGTPKTDVSTADSATDVPAHPCGAPCANGMACSVKLGACIDTCASLACVSGEFCAPGPPAACQPIACTLPTAWSPTVHKVAALALAAAATGCDLDDDGKPNNVLGKVIGLNPSANTVYGKQILAGVLVMLLESENWSGGDKKFSQRWLRGAWDDAQPVCDPTSATAKCKYRVKAESYVLNKPGPCGAAATFAVEATGTTLAGESAGTLPLAVHPGVELALPARNLRFSGTLGPDGTSLSFARLCGTVAKSELDAAVQAIPDEALQGISRARVQQRVTLYFAPDVDTDGDKVKDAVSFAFDLSTVPGVITGLVK